jgi:hypothetical protein
VTQGLLRAESLSGMPSKQSSSQVKSLFVVTQGVQSCLWVLPFPDLGLVLVAIVIVNPDLPNDTANHLPSVAQPKKKCRHCLEVTKNLV